MLYFFYSFCIFKIIRKVYAQNIQNIIIKHQQIFKSAFRKYFLIQTRLLFEYQNLFKTDATEIIDLTATQEYQLINICCNSNFKKSSLFST